MNRTGIAALTALALVCIAQPVRAQTASVTLTWTCPGDDSLVGTATQYQVRYRQVAPPPATDIAGREAWWTAATDVTGLPVPLLAGSTQSIIVPGVPQGSSWWVIRTRDEVPGQWSGWSNVVLKQVTDAVRPAPITDAR